MDREHRDGEVVEVEVEPHGGNGPSANSCGVGLRTARSVSVWAGFVTIVALGCNDRPIGEVIDWPAPDEVAQKRMANSCLVLEGGLKCWSSRPASVDEEPEWVTGLQRDLHHPGPPLPFVDFGSDARVLAVASREGSMCVVLEGEGVKCWGRNGLHALGRPDPDEVVGDDPEEGGAGMPFVDLGSNRDVIGITAHRRGYCALFRDGRVKCWGGGSPVLGLGDRETRGDDPDEMGDALPYVDLGTGVRAVGLHSAMGGHSYAEGHVCIWTDEGHVKCWGDNDRGQLGIPLTGQAIGDDPGEMGDALPYVDLGEDVFVVQVSVGWRHTCALTDEGRVKCWGANSSLYADDQLGMPCPLYEAEWGPTCEEYEPFEFGRLGLGDREDRVAPLDQLPYVDLGKNVRAVGLSASARHTCAVLDDGGLKCWGTHGGYEDREPRGDQPGQMGEALPYLDLGRARSVRVLLPYCALLDDDSVKCWIGGEPGTMGDNLEPVVTREDLYESN